MGSRDAQTAESRAAEIQMLKEKASILEAAERFYGFKINYEKCTKASVSREKNIVMTNGHDTILVSRDPATNTWKFWDTSRDKMTNSDIGGDIINFVQWQEPSLNLGHVRKKLRDLTGTTQYQPIRQYSRPAHQEEKDFDYVKKFISDRRHATTSSYLESRGITRETLQHPLFKNRILKGFDGAVVFPHYNANGACGYEVRSETVRNFTKKGVKGLWYSQVPQQVNKIIFTESAIEALSHFQLKQPENTAYYSAGGNWDPDSVGSLMEKVMQKYPGATIVAAFNNDKGGQRQTEKLAEHANRVGRSVQVDVPGRAGLDWNDMLNESLRLSDDLKKKTELSLAR